MLEAYPKSVNLDRQLLARFIEAAVDCAQACTACADACLSQDEVADLTKCIRTDLDCADITDTTARVLSRHTAYDANLTRALVQACAQARKSCGDECEQHAQMHEHCRVCAEACRPEGSSMAAMGSHDMGGMSEGEHSGMAPEPPSELMGVPEVEFDRVFLEMMIEHHRGAVAMAQDEQAEGQYPDALALAETVETDQTAEIERMQQLLRAP